MITNLVLAHQRNRVVVHDKNWLHTQHEKIIYIDELFQILQFPLIKTRLPSTENDDIHIIYLHMENGCYL